MRKKNARQVSSRSGHQDARALSAATLALGEKLVAELKLVESTDTLTRWMAHHVAELIVRADDAPLPERDQARRECARAISDLWAQASAFPAEDGPFDSIGRVIEVMDLLHPDGSPYYRNSLWRALEEQPKSANNEVKHLLESALGIDEAARNLIHYILSEASRVAGRECAEWLELARQLDNEDPMTELRVRILMAGQEGDALRTHRVDQLQKRIEQLSHFAAAADTLKTYLTEALTAVQAENTPPEEWRSRPDFLRTSSTDGQRPPR